MQTENKGIKITALSSFLPEGNLSNYEIAKRFNSDPLEIFKKTGVMDRRITKPDFLMSDMGFEAAEKLFKIKSQHRDEIDALILVGHGFDFKAPVTSAILQNRLRLKKECFVMDIPQGCTGYIYGLSISKSILSSGIAKKVLLITADTPSFVIDKNDEELLSLFGDAATASIIELGNSFDEKYFFGTDGSGYDLLCVEKSGTRNPPDIKWLTQTSMLYGKMSMKSTEIFSFAIRTVPGMVNQILEKNSLSIDQIDLFVFHQANSFLLEVLRKKMKIPQEKFINDISETGNTVSSTIPIALLKAESQGKLKRGMNVLLAGFGLGLSWAGTIIKY